LLRSALLSYTVGTQPSTTWKRPDLMVFDLDPDPRIEWRFVSETALALRELLERERLECCWPKLTGGKGLHLMVSANGAMTHDEAHRYSRALAERLAATRPERYTTLQSRRRGWAVSSSTICAMAAVRPQWPLIRHELGPASLLLPRPLGKSWRKGRRDRIGSLWRSRFHPGGSATLEQVPDGTRSGLLSSQRYPCEEAKSHERRQKQARKPGQQAH